MKKAAVCIFVLFSVMTLLFPTVSHAQFTNEESIVVATGDDVPADDYLPEDYRFPERYRDNAVQFRTKDGILLCGYVLGNGTQGVTLAHASGWELKSWLPFAERLVDEGYMVIIWEFRGTLIESTWVADDTDLAHWNLDVLAAAQVLREYGATEIFCMGASNGGTATAMAAPDIPELIGLGILSSPSNSPIGNAVEAMEKIKDVPAFFAVSENDSAGVFPPEVEALYNAYPSTQKQFNLIEDFSHGTDMITPDMPEKTNDYGWTGYGQAPADNAERERRQELSDKLIHFVNEAFEINKSESETSQVIISPSEGGTTNGSSSVASEEANNSSENDNSHNPVIWIAIGVTFICVFAGSAYAHKRMIKK